MYSKKYNVLTVFKPRHAVHFTVLLVTVLHLAQSQPIHVNGWVMTLPLF